MTGLLTAGPWPRLRWHGTPDGFLDERTDTAIYPLGDDWDRVFAFGWLAPTAMIAATNRVYDQHADGPFGQWCDPVLWPTQISQHRAALQLADWTHADDPGRTDTVWSWWTPDRGIDPTHDEWGLSWRQAPNVRQRWETSGVPPAVLPVTIWDAAA